MEGGCGSDQLELPGFRFHPTEEELLDFYLRRAAAGKKLNFDIIGTLNLYHYDPWDLPALSKIGEREWYFFVPRDRRQGNGGRPNRTTERGFWKATGSDRPIHSAAEHHRRLIGLKKTLVYYHGRAPRGTKTDWVMNEYRLPPLANSAPQEDIVLCKVYRKATSLKELEQRAAMEEDSVAAPYGGAVSAATSSDQENVLQKFGYYDEVVTQIKEEFEASVPREVTSPLVRPPKVPLLESSAAGWSPVIMLESRADQTTSQSMPAETPAARQPPSLPALQVPSQTSLDWMQDSFLSQLRSPWLDQWSPLYANLMNF